MFRKWEPLQWFAIIALIGAITLAGLLVYRTAQLTEGTRRVLCIGILHNEANTARNEKGLQDICAEVGIYEAP